MTRPRYGTKPLPKRTRDTLQAAQDRITIRRMLDQGGIATAIGPKTHIRIPAGGFGTFDSALVEEVEAARLRSSPGAGE